MLCCLNGRWGVFRRVTSLPYRCAVKRRSREKKSAKEKSKYVDSEPRSDVVLYPGWQLRSKHSWISKRINQRTKNNDNVNNRDWARLKLSWIYSQTLCTTWNIVFRLHVGHVVDSILSLNVVRFPAKNPFRSANVSLYVNSCAYDVKLYIAFIPHPYYHSQHSMTDATFLFCMLFRAKLFETKGGGKILEQTLVLQAHAIRLKNDVTDFVENSLFIYSFWILSYRVQRK